MAVAANRLLALACGATALVACGATPLDSITIDPRMLSTGLVAHWTFDERTGTTVADQSGNGHDGALTGGTWTAAGRFGGALRLALGDYVTVANFPPATSSWTVSAWIQMSDAQVDENVATADYGSILSTEIPLTGGYQLQLDDRPGYERFRAAYWVGAASTGTYAVDNCQCVASNEWIHLTAVFDDGAQQLTLYRGDSVAAQTAMPAPIQPGDATLYMGRWNMDVRFLAADLDDVAIWSRALSMGEVAVVSQQPPPD